MSHKTLEEAEKFGKGKYGDGNFIIDPTAYGYKAKRNDRRALTSLEREFVHKEEKEKNIDFVKIIKEDNIRYYIFKDKNNKEIRYCLVLVRQEPTQE